MRKLALLLFLFALAGPAIAQQPDLPHDRAALREHLAALSTGRTGRAAAARAMLRFYEAREFAYFWLEDGRVSERGAALLNRLSAARDQGLDAAWYDTARLRTRTAEIARDERVEIELALMRALLRYAREVRSGRIREPRRVRGTANRPEGPLPEATLTGLAASGDINAYLDGLPPQSIRYRRLVSALARYRAFAEAGAWPQVPAGETLKAGMTNPRVAVLRARLRTTGDLTGPAAENPAQFDGRLVGAVRAFQDRTGLTVDGEVGEQTRAQLNVPAETRVDQIIINLERRRWRAELLEDRYVWVNAAAQEAKLVEQGETIFETRVIVGTRRLQTPEFSARAVFIQLNPYWNVPRSIAVNEMLPRIRRDPGYLTRNHYLLLRVAGDNSTAVNPQNVDWSQIDRDNFPYAIRQTPGRWNALGRLILRFPNRFNVYMHDTPSCNLFEREVRTFSHGCIRTENPHRLAAMILRHQPGNWTEARLQEMTTGETGPTHQIDIANPFWVHITYITAWADRAGRVQFRRDFYNRDPPLLRAMRLR